MSEVVDGRPLVEGSAEGALLYAEIGLSFWGGVDPASGMIIDQHHPLSGTSLVGRVLAIPSGRGSCTGSSVLLELSLNGHAPAAIVLCEREEILTLGALVAKEMFGVALPVFQVDREVFAKLGTYRHARIESEGLRLFREPPNDGWQAAAAVPTSGPDTGAMRLEAVDHAFLAGRYGKAAQMAMRLLLWMASLQGADSLIDVSQVHVDGCIYTGPASLRFAQLLLEGNAQVRVPTTLNAISVDQRRWRSQGVADAFGRPAAALADAYVAMGARPTFTCAPYLLDTAPGFGEQVGWAESNAVVYANSVIGARTMKYPDYLDICIALTGRAPRAGCHEDAGRVPTLEIDLVWPDGADDAFWPLAGYCCGAICGNEIPLIRGLERSGPSADDLKAFGAAFATMAGAPMFHIAGVTPEAEGHHVERRVRIGIAELQRGWKGLNSSEETDIGLVSLGNPHVSFAECSRLAALVRGRTRAPSVAVIVTCGRHIYEQACQAGFVVAAELFGVQFITDTCWCMIGEPIVPPATRTLMTNSGKYAHYAPGLVGRRVRFGSLAACVEAACSGQAEGGVPAWLQVKDAGGTFQSLPGCVVR